jgi:hypothetical protein
VILGERERELMGFISLDINFFVFEKQKTIVKEQQLFFTRVSQQEHLIQDVFGVSLRNTRLKGFTLLLLL